MEQISTRCTFAQGANCAHERNLLKHMYNLILDFDKLPIISIRTCIKIIYINRRFIKLKVMGILCSHYFIGFAGLSSRTTGISGPWASICTVLFLNNISS